MEASNNQAPPYIRVEPSTSVTRFMAPQEHSLALMENMARMQSRINPLLLEELERSSLALKSLGEEATETQDLLVRRVALLESERPAFQMQLNEVNRAHEAKSLEYERRMQNLEAQLRASQAELSREKGKVKDYDDALNKIKESVIYCRSVANCGHVGTMVRAPYNVYLTSEEQLRKLNKLI